jgi:hypothetical protein
MSNVQEAELVDELGRKMVESLAPQELPIYKANSKAYFADPSKALEGTKQKDEALAFDVAAAGATFLTPVILAVVSEVIKHLVDAVKETVKTEGATLLSETVSKYLSRLRPSATDGKSGEEPEAEEYRVSSEELETIHRLAYDRAIGLNLNESSARTLADSLVGSIVIAS